MGAGMIWMDNISNGSAKSESNYCEFDNDKCPIETIEDEFDYHSPADCPNMELKWDDGGCYPRKDVKYCEHCSADLWVDNGKW